jgi:hypothetical protein
MPAKLELLEVEVSEGVRTITIHHKHPACIMTLDLSRELATAIEPPTHHIRRLALTAPVRRLPAAPAAVISRPT